MKEDKSHIAIYGKVGKGLQTYDCTCAAHVLHVQPAQHFSYENSQ
jgi:hypothetical protein